MWHATLLAMTLLGAKPVVPYVADVTVALWETVTHDVPQTQLLLDATTSDWLWQNLYASQAEIDYWSAFVFVNADSELWPWLELTALLNSGEVRTGSSLVPPIDATLSINDQTISAAASQVTFIRELSLTAHHKAWSLQAGKQRVTMAQGLLYDDFAVGAVLRWQDGDLAPVPVTGELAALWLGQSPQAPMPQSPLVYARATYTLSIFESIGVFGAYYSDTAGSLGDVLEAAVAERIIAEAPLADKQTRLTNLFDEATSSLGSVWYVGVDWHVMPGEGWDVRGAALLQRGQLTFAPVPNATLALNLTGWAAHASVSREVVPWLTVSALGFALSGDEPPPAAAMQWTYGSYIGVAPFYTWSGLFFSGGLNQGFFAGRATAAGINGHGVVGGGLAGTWGGDDLRADVRALYLSALADAPAFAGGGLSYGCEFDVIVHWALLRWLSLALEVDTLVPGNFFPASAGTALRIIGQVYVAWGS